MASSQFDILTEIAPIRRLSDEEVRRRAIIIGVVCTVLFHVGLIWLAPHMSFGGPDQSRATVSAPKYTTVDFQLAPPPEPPPPPTKFVETNPDAPQNTPDNTANFSNRNQQSAQAVAAKEIDPENRPSVQGQDKIKSDAIVTGQHAKPQDGSAAKTASTSQAKVQQMAQHARAEQIPLSGIDKLEGKSDEGIASNVSASKETTNNARQLVDGAHTGNGTEGGTIDTNQITKMQPRPRPRLSQVRQNVLQNRLAGTANIGLEGYDARWTPYGQYLQELIEAVDFAWHALVDNYPANHPGTSVSVTFKINSEGIPTITTVEDTNGGKVAIEQCKTAITSPQPYKKWSQEMISVLGDEQTITFTFYYE